MAIDRSSAEWPESEAVSLRYADLRQQLVAVADELNVRATEWDDGELTRSKRARALQALRAVIDNHGDWLD